MKTARGGRLPSLTVRDMRSGDTIRLRASRGPVVLLLVHEEGCPTCAEIVADLAKVTADLWEWGGRLVVVSDPESRLATGPLPRITIADEWGEIYFAAEAEDDHALVTSREVLEWVRFVGVQCPECEGPEGEWRSMRQG